MQTLQPSEIADPQKTLQAELLEAFDRFYSVASFYPADHSQCQNALVEFYKAIDRVVPSGEFLVLEPDQDGIQLQGVYLDQSHLGAERISTLLDTLGLARLSINSKAPLEDLHSTVTTLNSLKLKAGSFQEFHSLDFQPLPSSVEISQRKFGWRQFKMDTENNISEKLLHYMNQLMEKVQEQPWSDARKEQFRRQTEDLLTRTVERMDTSEVRSLESQRSLEDVLMLGAGVVQKAISAITDDEDGRSLNQIFHQAAESLAYESDRESLEVIFDVLKEGDSQSPAETHIPLPDETNYSLSIADLTGKVMKISATATDPEIVSSVCSREMLTICLHMITGAVAGNHAESLGKILASQLSLPIAQDRVDTLEKALSDLVAAGDRTPIDHLFPLVAPHLLRNNSEGFARFLSRRIPTHHPEELALLWPHLVGVMLMPKPPQNKVLLEYLNKAIASLPVENVREEAHRLDFLAVIQSGKIGSALLHWPLAQSHNVLVTLMTGRQGTQIGKRLNRLWSDKAPNKLAGVLMRVLGPYEAKHQKLYTTILNFSLSGVLSEESRDEISLLIQKTLGKLEKSARNAAWVPHAMEELGRMGGGKNEKFLNEVLNLKRIIFLHAWPGESRKAAQKALENISADNRGDRS